MSDDQRDWRKEADELRAEIKRQGRLIGVLGDTPGKQITMTTNIAGQLAIIAKITERSLRLSAKESDELRDLKNALRETTGAWILLMKRIQKGLAQDGKDP